MDEDGEELGYPRLVETLVLYSLIHARHRSMSEICERCQTVHLLRDALQRAVSVLRQEDECDSGRWGLSARVAAEDLREKILTPCATCRGAGVPRAGARVRCCLP